MTHEHGWNSQTCHLYDTTGLHCIWQWITGSNKCLTRGMHRCGTFTYVIFIRLMYMSSICFKYSSKETEKWIDEMWWNLDKIWNCVHQYFFCHFLYFCVWLKFFIIKNWKKYYVDISENIHNDSYNKKYKVITDVGYNHVKYKCVAKITAIAISTLSAHHGFWHITFTKRNQDSEEMAS